MNDHDVFWRLEALSNRHLLERLGSVLGSSRRLMAELIAHLGEVEVRRLHLAAACSSMFAYCLKLGMTEDEAYRRIEVARLARRYPAIFPLLANGQLSISVVALLKHHLSNENHQELLTAATGKSVAQTRELIASRFPRPDVPSSVRKLPERRTLTQPSLATSPPPEASASGTEPGTGVTEPSFTYDVTTATEVPASAAPADVARKEGPMSFAQAVNATRATAPERPAHTDSQRVAPSHPSDSQRVAAGGERRPTAPKPAPTDSQRVVLPARPSRIEPLSPQRYKVQFTGSAELARKLELARDLMRHCHPGGELGPIVERALDLLIERLMQRRFGEKARPKRTSASSGNTDPEPRSDVMSDRSTIRGAAEPSATLAEAPTHHTLTRDAAEPTTNTTPDAEPAGSEMAGSEMAGSEMAGSEMAGSEVAGSEVAGSEMAGSVPSESVTPDSAPAPDSAPPAVVTPIGVTRESAPAESPLRESAAVEADRRGELTRAPASSYIPRATRRAVVDRDGLGCSWVDAYGVRCGSRAWLEYDHRHPRAMGGGSEPDNVRLLCRGHNRFAAERAYGRKHVERTIAERQRDERCT